MNLSNLEKILQNPDTELKAQIQNQMTSEQLKHLIEDKFPMYPNGDLTGMNQMNAQRVVGAKLCLNDPSILRHADPEIMKQAGWVREDEWVSVEDRLPQTDYLIDVYFVRDNYVYEGEYSPVNKRFYISYDDGTFAKNVTHWKLKQLPQPPKQ